MPVHRGEAEIVIATRPAPSRREAAVDEGAESSFAPITPLAALGGIVCSVRGIQLIYLVFWPCPGPIGTHCSGASGSLAARRV
jgi:hypothetical protein